METTTCQDCHISSLIGLTENKIKMNQKKQMNLSVLQTFNYYHRCLLLFCYPLQFQIHLILFQLLMFQLD